MSRALVLGGGGVTGIAWELGILKGLRDSGVDLTGADTIIGTSAGSVVGTQLSTGLDLDELYDEQIRPVDTSEYKSLGAGKLDKRTLVRMVSLMVMPGNGEVKRQRLGRASIKAHPEAPTDRMRVMRTRIGDPEWPERDLRITAVNAHTGAFVIFDRSSGVPLIEAVAASCSVPLIWPPVPIGEATYIDGGARSVANADQATGFATVIVIAPIAQAVSRRHSLSAQLTRTGAAHTASVVPDKAARNAIGPNLLDPGRRAAAAEAGAAQGRGLAERIGSVWQA
ncbi:MAG: patatin-like phospholipase family protein [Marmoricola sp.]|jgi:NTE family protein|nr:patatin-like phospholipase family protein [Marmoricola sp.]